MLFHVLIIVVRLISSVWASPFQQAQSTSVLVGNDLRKREHVIECDALDIELRTWEITSFTIGNLRDLCLGYPQGLGASCDGPEIVMRLPLNPLYFNVQLNGGGGIAQLCRRFCRCTNVAPDPPDIREVAFNRGEAGCILDEGNDIIPSPVQSQASQASETTQCSPNNNDNDGQEDIEGTMKYSSHYQCDGSFYGHPDSADCRTAIQRLPDWGVDRNIYREYYSNGDPPDNSNSVYVHYGQTINDRTSFTFGDSVKAPLILNHGTCTVAILIPSDPQESVFVRSKALIRVTENLEAKCVIRSGSGGKFDHVWDTSSESDRWYPDVFIFGKKSLMESWLDLISKARRLSDEDTKTGPGEISGTGPVPKGSQQTCSGSCMNPNDCDIKSNCVCASDKPVPLSSTWGQHACMYLAGAALAMAQNSAIRPHSRCRGRCLLEDDNDNSNATDLLALANRTKTAMMSFNATLARLARPAAAISSVIPSAINDKIINATQPNDLSSTSLLSNTTTTTSLHRLRLQNQNQSSTIINLTCPCNCTYVSAACCLSPTVWEPPTQQIRMETLPVNATLRCDKVSGEWLPRPLELTSTSTSTSSTLAYGGGAVPTESNDSPVGFVGLGSVNVESKSIASSSQVFP